MWPLRKLRKHKSNSEYESEYFQKQQVSPCRKAGAGCFNPYQYCLSFEIEEKELSPKKTNRVPIDILPCPPPILADAHGKIPTTRQTALVLSWPKGNTTGKE